MKFGIKSMLILKKNQIDSVWKKKKKNSKPKSDYDKAIHFHNKEMLNVGPNYAYLAVITIDSVFKEDETYQPKVFLKERKYNEKR